MLIYDFASPILLIHATIFSLKRGLRGRISFKMQTPVIGTGQLRDPFIPPFINTLLPSLNYQQECRIKALLSYSGQ